MLKLSGVRLGKKALPAYKKLMLASAGVAGAASVVVLSSGGIPAMHEAGGHVQDHARHAASRALDASQSTAAYIRDRITRAVAALEQDASTAVKVATTRWLAKWSAEEEAREAMLSLGGSSLLDFLLHTACEDPSMEQTQAEAALTNFLSGSATAPKVLERPSAVPLLLRHISSGKASEQLPVALMAAAEGGNFGGSRLRYEDGQATIALMTGRHGSQVQQLAAAVLAGWARGSGTHRLRLAALGLNAALADVAMEAVSREEEEGRQLRLLVMRLIQVMAKDASATNDADMARWVRPLLFTAADAAATGDLPLADAAMLALSTAATAGGPLAKSALQRGHLLPTLECLAQSSAEEVRARSARAVGPLVLAGLLEEEKDRERWRERLLGWLVDGRLAGQLRGECVAGLAALCAKEGVGGLQVAHDWLAVLLEHLAARVSAYTQLLRLDLRAREEAWQDAAPVTPAYVRSVAEDLRKASLSVRQAYATLPADVDPGLLGPAVAEKPPPAVVDLVLAEKMVCSALEVLCAMVADDPTKQQWLPTVGILPLLERLCPLDELLHQQQLEQQSQQQWQQHSQTQQRQQKQQAQQQQEHQKQQRQQPQQQWQGQQGKPAASLPNSGTPGASSSSASGSSYTSNSSSIAAAARPSVGSTMHVSSASSTLPATASNTLPPVASSTFPSLLSSIFPSLVSSIFPSFFARAITPPAGQPTIAPAATAARAAGANAATTSSSTEGPGKSAPGPSSSSSSSNGSGIGSSTNGNAGASGGKPGSTSNGSSAAAELAATAEATAAAEEQAGAQPGSGNALLDDTSKLCVQRQTARLLAMLCLQPGVAEAIRGSKWLKWLQAAAEMDDCKLSSHATVALLHLEAVQLQQQEQQRQQEEQARAAAALQDALGPLISPPTKQQQPTTTTSASATASAAATTPAAASATAATVRLRWPNWRSSTPHMIYADGIHLLNPDAPHHRALLRHRPTTLLDSLTAAASAAAVTAAADLSQSDIGPEDLPGVSPAGTRPAAAGGTGDVWVTERAIAGKSSSGSSEAAAEPEFDIVFVHGIRGGPFITWRKLGAFVRRGAAARHLSKHDCWPSDWLAKDLPGARLLSVEYQAPLSGWEGESLSLPDTVRLVMDKLLAAGVGQRPVVFVSHSMGGLLVKEMLCAALEEGNSGAHSPLVTNTRGVVFYGTPHLGSTMAAVGWKLRHVPGTALAPSINHLAPGPHLVELNEKLRAMHAEGMLGVLSFTEGQPTQVSGLIPKLMIVPFESGCPGYGLVHVLSGRDHIGVCKPVDKEDPAYALTLQFIRRATEGDGDAEGAAMAAMGPGAVAGAGGVAGAAGAAGMAGAGPWQQPGGAVVTGQPEQGQQQHVAGVNGRASNDKGGSGEVGRSNGTAFGTSNGANMDGIAAGGSTDGGGQGSGYVNGGDSDTAGAS